MLTAPQAAYIVSISLTGAGAGIGVGAGASGAGGVATGGCVELQPARAAMMTNATQASIRNGLTHPRHCLKFIVASSIPIFHNQFYHEICSIGIFRPSISTIIFPVGKRNIIGAKVKQARKTANPPITQMDLLARLQLLDIKIDQSGISKIESGQRPVSDIEVIALAKALRVSAAWLLEETNVSSDQGC